MTPIDKDTVRLIIDSVAMALRQVPSITHDHVSWGNKCRVVKEWRINKGWGTFVEVRIASFFFHVAADVELTSKIDRQWDSGTVEIRFNDDVHGKATRKFLWSLEGDNLNMFKLPSA